MPEVIECQDISNNRNEIPTPDIVKRHPHLRRVMTELCPLNCETEIRLIVGRDAIDAHHVLEVFEPPISPFAQRLKLGWVIRVDMCIRRNHSPDKVNSCETYITSQQMDVVQFYLLVQISLMSRDIKGLWRCKVAKCL